MEGDKRRTREDTWKSDELKKHLTGSLSDNQSDDKRHRERKPRERDGWDAHDYKGSLYKEQGKGRVKSKERTGEKARFKSSERHREERKESGREKDHPREREREKFKATRDRHGKEEKQSAGRGAERQNGGERERKHRKDDPNHAHMQNTAVIYGERSKEHYRRRGSKDYRGDITVLRTDNTLLLQSVGLDVYYTAEEHADPLKAREEEKERRYSERKNKEAKNHEGEISKYRDEEHEHRRRSHREEELDRDRKRSHKEKREWERSVVEGKEKLLKESLRAYKDGQEGHVPRSRKEPPFHEDRLYKESNERRQKEDGEMKKRDHKPSEHKSQRKSSRHEDETEHLRERSSKEKIKNQARSEKEDTRQEEPIKDIANPANSDADYDNYSVNYEEDFEDYEDDFDDTDDDEDDVEGQGSGEREEEAREAEEKVRKVPVFKNSEIEEIQKAINAENERVQTFLPEQRKNEFLPKEGEKELGMERQDSPRRSPVFGKFIDFQTAKRQQSIRKVASEQKKRSLELLRLIDLDFSVSFCLLDLPPVNEYDMYIRNFGKTNTKQAYVQWNEDNLERDVQTEEIEMQEKWTQHPGETAIVCGGPKKSSSDVSVLAPKIDSQRLASFLRSACQVIAVLLEEDQVATQPRRNLRSRQTSLSISDKCFQLNTNLPFLQGRKVSCLHISQAQRQALLSVHTFPEKPSDLPLDRKNIICVWNVWQPSNPQKILFCGSQVTCCCFSPSKATLVFAGTGDGSVLVWDLREDSRMHHCMNFNETDWAFRSPTFSTDGVFTSLSHMCPILTIEPVSTTVFKEQNCGLSYLSSREELLGLSFQIASMDENGILSLWVVVELQKEDLAGSQRDLGLIPGGKVKLVHSSTFQMKCSYLPKDNMCLGTCQPLNIKFLPSNPNHFIVGTDMAVVSHGTRHELKAPPKLFKPQQGGARSARVNAMDFSPFGKPLFLAGCSDGSIRLHQMTSELPLIQWNASTAGQPIIALQWALTRPAVFFALDAMSVVYVWDLLETDLSPVAKQPTQADKVLTMAVLGEPEKLNGLLGLALAKESGIIEIWYVKKKWAVPQPEESEKLNLLLQQAL